MRTTHVERRIVTVLFADLVGFTPLAEQLDAEDLATVQESYFAVVRQTIGRHGGVVEKFIGDAVMAVFGVPVARDDDGERAVRAGLALTTAIDSLGPRLGLESALALRVGIQSGEVVTTSARQGEAALVTGEVVNVAARLQTAAPVGGVLLGETAALGVADAIELAAPEAIELKGKSEPVRVRRAVALRPQPSRDFALAGLRAPIVGRERELGLLAETVSRVAEGASERLLVVAPPGLGKSRLLRELATIAPSAAVWQTRVRPVQTSPYEPVVTLVRAALADAGIGAAVPDGADEVRAALLDRLERAAVAPARSAAVADEVLALAWPAAGSRSAGREAAFSAWTQALDALAGGRAALWAVEDVHWASADLLNFFEQAASAPTAVGRLVIATARPAVLEHFPEWCAARPGAVTIDLPPLDRGATAVLLRALAGDLPVDLERRIVDRAGGTPLFVEELLRTWISAGVLVAENGGWRLAATADVPLPPSVQAVYAAQLDDLPAAAREVARRAAVAGRRFSAGALELLAAEEQDEGLDVLRRRALIVGPTDEPELGVVYHFRHALLRDAAYATLARRDRAALHARLARWLEEAVGDDRRAAVIAEHYAAALDATPELAATTADDLTRREAAARAAAWFERAGEHALRFAARDTAQALFGRAVDLTPERSLLRARRLLRRGSATADAADLTDGIEIVTEALELARSLAVDEEGRRLAALATATLARLWMQQIRFDDVVALATQALPEADGTGEPEARLRLVRALGAMGATNRHDEASDDVDRALDVAYEIGSESLELDALGWFLAARAPDRAMLAAAEFERIRELASRLGRWETLAQALENEALLLLDDDASTALRLLEAAEELSEARHLTEDLAWVDCLRCEALLAQGRFDAAREAAARAIERGREHGYHRVVLRSWCPLLTVGPEPDRQLLDTGWRWWTEVRDRIPRSPFGQLMITATELAFSRYGFQSLAVPEIEPLMPSFRLGYGAPSYLAAVDAVVACWFEAGRHEEADAAIAAAEDARSHPAASERSRRHVSSLRAQLPHREAAPAPVEHA